MMLGSRGLLDAAGSVGGLALAGAFAVLGRLRRGRPLHPQGSTYAARVRIRGGGASGVAWLDQAGSWSATLRVSRGVGLDPALPDVHGIAVRVEDAPSAPFDLLLASTGDSALGRFVFVPRQHVGDGALTTLLPVRSARGPLLLRLTADGRVPRAASGLPGTLTLAYAHGMGTWQEVGEVVVGQPCGPEAERERHDPITHQLPGTSQYPLVRRLREPAYAAARTVPADPRR
jgi:hypothetical protein